MSITTVQPIEAKRIFTTSAEGVDRQKLKAALDELNRHGRLTDRDERLMEYLRELNVLSLDQVHRLLWPGAKPVTAYQRLRFLLSQQLLNAARVPRAGMTGWGLPVGKVYALGPGGRMWLKEEVGNGHGTRHLRRDQVLHDLLVAELCVRLTEATRKRGESWSLVWAGEHAATFYLGELDASVLAPDGLGIVRQQRGSKTATLPFFVEMDASRESHGRPSSDWGRKVIGYDRFHTGEWRQHPELLGLTTFPLVAVVTHGEQRLHNLAAAITEHRRQPVPYYLALWEDWLAGEDLLTAPAWLIVTAEGKLVGQERGQRQPLLPTGK
jgi:DNA-binding PadR family transcriptional regulator